MADTLDQDKKIQGQFNSMTHEGAYLSFFSLSTGANKGMKDVNRTSSPGYDGSNNFHNETD